MLFHDPGRQELFALRDSEVQLLRRHPKRHPGRFDDLTVQIEGHLFAVPVPDGDRIGLNVFDVLGIIPVLSGLVGADDPGDGENVHGVDHQHIQLAVGGVGLGHRIVSAAVKPAVGRQDQRIAAVIGNAVDLHPIGFMQTAHKVFHGGGVIGHGAVQQRDPLVLGHTRGDTGIQTHAEHVDAHAAVRLDIVQGHILAVDEVFQLFKGLAVRTEQLDKIVAAAAGIVGDAHVGQTGGTSRHLVEGERFEQKNAHLIERLRLCNNHWEDAFFITLARNFGFSINGDAFEEWAKRIPLRAIDKHRNDLFQVEAFFFGQAGILSDDDGDDYYLKLKHEYKYLAHKFGLSPMDVTRWRFLRLRPNNFPHVRIAQLASLYHRSYGLLSQLLEKETIKEVRDLLRGGTSEYWLNHYCFGGCSPNYPKTLCDSSLNLIIINTVIPILYAYGIHRGKEKLCVRATRFLEEMKPYVEPMRPPGCSCRR